MATAKTAEAKGKSATKAVSGKTGTAKTSGAKPSSGKTATVSKTVAKAPVKATVSRAKTASEKAAPKKPEPKASNNVRESAPAVRKGDYFKFGSYCQESSSKKTPIEWLVLKKSGSKVLLISRYGLDCKQYHHEKVDMTWENCDLRKWLNGELIRNAFTAAEQKKIAVTRLPNDNNARYGTFGGNSTEDRVFCLSLAEAESLSKDDVARKCVPTPYAVGNGAWQSSENFIDGRGCCFWWLRSPGDYRNRASGVYAGGAGFQKMRVLSEKGNAKCLTIRKPEQTE